MENKIYKKYRVLTDYPPYENLEFREGHWKEAEDPIFDEDRALSYYYEAIKTADFDFEEDAEDEEYRIWLEVGIYHEDYKYEDEPIYFYKIEETKIKKDEDTTIIEDKRIPFAFIKKRDIKIENNFIKIENIIINKKKFDSEQFEEVQLFNDNEQLEDYFFIAHEELKNLENNNKYEILY